MLYSSMKRTCVRMAFAPSGNNTKRTTCNLEQFGGAGTAYRLQNLRISRREKICVDLGEVTHGIGRDPKGAGQGSEAEQDHENNRPQENRYRSDRSGDKAGQTRKERR